MEESFSPTTPGVPTPERPMVNIPLIAGMALVLLGAFGVAFFFLWYPDYQRSRLFAQTQDAFDQGNLQGALDRTNGILKNSPADANALAAKSLVLAQKGSTEFKEKEYGAEAEGIANEAITADSNNSEAWRALGYAYEIQEKYSKAHESYQRAIALDPQNALALFSDAHAYDLEGNRAKAEAGYRATVAVDSSMSVGHAGLGRVYTAEGKHSEAIAEFKLAYEWTHNLHQKAEAAYSLGALLLATGDVVGAHAYMTEATTLDPSYPSGWQGLGEVLFAQSATTTAISGAERAGFLNDAIAALSKAVSLNPNQSLAYVNLGILFSGLEKKDVARTAFTKAVEAVPQDITLSATEKVSLIKRIGALSAKLK